MNEHQKFEGDLMTKDYPICENHVRPPRPSRRSISDQDHVLQRSDSSALVHKIDSAMAVEIWWTVLFPGIVASRNNGLLI